MGGSMPRWRTGGKPDKRDPAGPEPDGVTPRLSRPQYAGTGTLYLKRTPKPAIARWREVWLS